MRSHRRVGVWLGIIAALLLVVVFVAACGESDETTTTAASTATTASTGSSTDATAAPSTDTTAAPSTDTTASASTEPIKIGVIAAQTGAAAAAMPSVMNALALVVGETNDSGGVNGRPIELIIVDDKSDVQTAVADMTKLVTQDNVTAVLGPLPQPNAAAVAQLSEKYEVPTLRWDTPTLNDPPGAKWAFTPSNGPQAVGAALLVQAKAEGWKNILAIGDMLPVDLDSIQVLKTLGEPEGITVTVMPDTWDLSVTDITPIVNKIMAEYKKVQPDAVVTTTSTVHAAALYKGLRALGVTVPIQNGPACAHPAILAMGPEAVEGLQLLDCGLMSPTELPDDFPGKALMIDFATRYKAEYDEQATLFTAVGVDSFNMLKEGLLAGGDDLAIIRDTIEGLQSYQGVQGVYSFSPEDHNGIHGGFCCWKVVNGAFTFVRTLN